jgi:ABC-2 type transport system ATP-binding protein
MADVRLEHVHKAYSGVIAVDDATFDVRGGEITALLGPNGAGKTSLIRMIMGITHPDRGTITYSGAAPTSASRHRIGYLPEERGLYRRQRVIQVLEYFGCLKGLSVAGARERARKLLVRLDLGDVAEKKVEALSKGMQQKVQIIGTILHEPDLVILDEPMSGLDPVNARLIIELIREERAKGHAVLLSTHQMVHAEALADSLVMINQGRIVLNGRRAEIQRRFSDGAVLIDRATSVEGMRTVARWELAGEHVRVTLAAGATPKTFLAEMLAADRVCHHFEQAVTPLEDIFIQLVEGARV